MHRNKHSSTKLFIKMANEATVSVKAAITVKDKAYAKNKLKVP